MNVIPFPDNRWSFDSLIKYALLEMGERFDLIPSFLSRYPPSPSRQNHFFVGPFPESRLRRREGFLKDNPCVLASSFPKVTPSGPFFFFDILLIFCSGLGPLYPFTMPPFQFSFWGVAVFFLRLCTSFPKP